MKNIKDIKNDITLEPHFLDYIRCAEESYDIPEEMPEDISEKESEKIIKLAYKTDVALTNLIEEINDKYETEFDIEEIDDDDEIADILNDTCDMYIEKHSIEKILARPLEFIDDDDLDMTDLILDSNLNVCTNCNADKEEVSYDKLPEEIKNDLKAHKDKGEFYLYCPSCEEYSIITNN